MNSDSFKSSNFAKIFFKDYEKNTRNFVLSFLYDELKNKVPNFMFFEIEEYMLDLFRIRGAFFYLGYRLGNGSGKNILKTSIFIDLFYSGMSFPKLESLFYSLSLEILTKSKFNNAENFYNFNEVLKIFISHSKNSLIDRVVDFEESRYTEMGLILLMGFRLSGFLDKEISKNLIHFGTNFGITYALKKSGKSFKKYQKESQKFIEKTYERFDNLEKNENFPSKKSKKVLEIMFEMTNLDFTPALNE